MPNDLATRVEEILSKEVGDLIARAALRKQCEMIGITVEALGPQHLPRLAERLRSAMSVYGGNAERVNREILMLG